MLVKSRLLDRLAGRHAISRMKRFKLPTLAPATKLKSGVLLTLSVLVALGFAAYILRLSLRWPESGSYLGVSSREQLKALLDTAAGVVTAVSTLGLVFVAIFGLQQLRLAKHDLRIRSQREARSVAIAQCERFAKEIIPANAEYLEAFAKLNIPIFDFQKAPLNFQTTDAGFLKRAQVWVGGIPPETQSKCIAVLNMLETWAMNFNQRIADSEAAYRPASDVFCRTVVQLYPFLILLRASNDPELFSNIEELFADWQGRKRGRVLEDQERVLTEQLSRIRKLNKQKPHPKPLGDEP